MTTASDFIGRYVSTGDPPPNINGNHETWYPSPGVILIVQEHPSVPNAARILIDPAGKPFGHQGAIEATPYRLQGDQLVGEIMDNGELVLTERLEMISGHRMKHILSFPDQAFGDWICIPK